jgi:iron uptake system component EfeO
MQLSVSQLNQACFIGLAISVVSSLAACGGNSTSSVKQADAVGKETLITVTNTGCEPGQLKVTAGKNTFAITNKTAKPLEWEIRDGSKVVEEKYNIAPGSTYKLKATLEPKNYVMTCGLRSNPRGKIIVSAAAN